MRNVDFKHGSEGYYFSYESENGFGEFEYRFSAKPLWKDIRYDEFEVELLINPLLNRESNTYELRGREHHTVGYLFPISLLDSDSDFGEYHNINNYVNVAFKKLLERIEHVKGNGILFSDNFEENICVCVLHKPSINMPHPLSQCIHSLRKYGYSYFEENNRIHPIKGYAPDLFFKNGKKKVILDFKEPLLYQNPMIDSILRALPKADNLTHRFVLLYQVIETLFEEIASRKIDEEIRRFTGKHIPCNDFQENIKQLSSEKVKLGEIFECCENLESSGEAKQFMEYCMQLFDLIHYSPSKNGLKDIFYAFRNQMTHSFRNLHGFPVELAETIQCFELLILKIIELYHY